MTDDLLEMVDVIDAVRTMLDHVSLEIPERYAEEFVVAYSALTSISDGMYWDATKGRTRENGGE